MHRLTPRWTCSGENAGFRVHCFRGSAIQRHVHCGTAAGKRNIHTVTEHFVLPLARAVRRATVKGGRSPSLFSRTEHRTRPRRRGTTAATRFTSPRARPGGASREASVRIARGGVNAARRETWPSARASCRYWRQRRVAGAVHAACAGSRTPADGVCRDCVARTGQASGGEPI